MKVNLVISDEHAEPHAVIYADRMTDEITRAVQLLGALQPLVAVAGAHGEMVVLKPEDIYMIRIESGRTIVYGRKESYRSSRRLYELKESLGGQFMQISRSTLINTAYMDRVEAGFSGALLLKLKNGCEDYVSRTYLTDFKKHLGL